jgi:FixJ family two-component response regulator
MKSNPVPAVIAVVDDDKSVRSATTSLLRSCGWTVRFYASGNDLLSEIDRGDIRLVIADVQMPVMDGFALLEKLSVIANTIPVVFITAYATPDMVNRIVNSGAAAFFPKPLDDVRFLARVTDIFNMKCR